MPYALIVIGRVSCLLVILVAHQCSTETDQSTRITSDRSLGGKTFVVHLQGPAAERFKDTAIRLILNRNHTGRFWLSKGGISEQMTIHWQFRDDSLTIEWIDTAKSEKRFPAQRFAVNKGRNAYQLTSSWERMDLTEYYFPKAK